MRVVLQRVGQASVTVDGVTVSQIGHGALLLVGVGAEDGDADIEWLTQKISKLRVFADAEGVMNRSLLETGGEVLAVSQFTLMASLKSGNRPSWSQAAPAAISQPLFEQFVSRLSQLLARPVATGVFGADMQVALLNDGPVTIWLDSKARD